MKLKAAFIFLSPDADSAQHRSQVITEGVELTVVGARNYADAITVATELSNDGITSIELCGGFGIAGTAQIASAVGNKAAVGAVRFDLHPGLDGKSGDSVFAE